jgi:hypothetical protein
MGALFFSFEKSAVFLQILCVFCLQDDITWYHTPIETEVQTMVN